MASLDSLPADQRAVLQLVLGRGRSYDEIARLLSIDRSAVRQRALSAFDALGPQTGVAEQQRAAIADYLLGQLPSAIATQTRDRLAESSSERAWARVLASELAPLASSPMPEIPAARPDGLTAEPSPSPAPEPYVLPASESSGSESAAPEGETSRRSRAVRREPQGAGGPDKPSDPGEPGPPRSSRRGGLVLIGVTTLVVLAVLVVLLASSGSDKNPGRRAVSPTNSANPAASSAAATTPTTGTGSTPGKVLAQINLTPVAAQSKAAGIAEVLKEGASDGVAIVAQNVPPNTTNPPNAYAVWLYNSPTDAHILGFVNPGVTSTGRLSTAGGLPSNASRYKKIVVTVETKANPTAPGTILLQGTLTGV